MLTFLPPFIQSLPELELTSARHSAALYYYYYKVETQNENDTML